MSMLLAPPARTLFDDYIERCESANRSAHYLKALRSTARAFCATFDELNDKTAAKFLSSSLFAASTRNVYLSHLTSVAGFANISLRRVVRTHEIDKEPEALSSVEVELLFNEAYKEDQSLAHIIRFMAETGLRIHEFLGLDASSIRTSATGMKYIKFVGKRKIERTVPLTKKALLAFENITFPIMLHRSTLNRRLDSYAKRAGIQTHVHLHLLRKTFASIALNEKNMASVDVARVGGWKNMSTMMKHYLKPDYERISVGMEA